MNGNDPFALSEAAEVDFETPDTHSHFFGYYVTSPFDATGTKLLCHRVGFDRRQIRPDDTATIGYWDLSDQSFVTLGETAAFNWQQGSMLQWLPPDYDQRIIYNDRDPDSFESVILNIDTGEETVLNNPIYAVHPSAEFALSANFERLAHSRPTYSYRGVKKPKWDVPVHDDDGIFRVDLKSGDSELIVGTREVCNQAPKQAFKHRDNWLEHLQWNPSGTRFAFVHRWSDGSGGFETRLFTADPDGSDLHMFPDTGLYSHMDWKNDSELTVWGIKPSSYQKTERFVRDNFLLESLLSPTYNFFKEHIIGSRMDEVLPDRAYLTYTDKSRDFLVHDPSTLTEDGHFTWRTDERWLLTDTYPNDEGYQNLLLYDDKSENLREIGQFYSSVAETKYKCDLHPRWDRSEQRIAVDSAHGDRRQMVVIDLDIF